MKGRRRSGVGTVYALAHPESGELRYIGKTVVFPRDRLRAHMRDALTKGTQTRVARWIRTLGGAEPTMVVLELCPIAEAGASERRWIAEYRQRGVRLTNLTDGGEGVPGFKLSDEHKAKIARATKARMATAEGKAMMDRINLARRNPAAPKSRYRPTDRAARDREASERLKRRWAERREEMLALTALARVAKAEKRAA